MFDLTAQEGEGIDLGPKELPFMSFTILLMYITIVSASNCL
jgi:hypothetical protein